MPSTASKKSARLERRQLLPDGPLHQRGFGVMAEPPPA
jgi:hypothetical protein